MARMIATENVKQKKSVTFLHTHTNHELGIEECKHLPLPQSVRRDIQQQFATGITIERIIDSKRVSTCIYICISTGNTPDVTLGVGI